MQRDITSFFSTAARTSMGQNETMREGEVEGSSRRFHPNTLESWYGIDVRRVRDVEAIRERLTVRPKHFGIGKPPDPYELTYTTKPPPSDDPLSDEGTATTLLWVPRFFGICTFGPPEKVLLRQGEEMTVPFEGTLNEAQRNAYDATMSKLLSMGGAVLVRKPGGGKTVLGIYVACQLKRRTLVVCHTSALVAQWEERIRQFAPSATVGRIQQKKTLVDADFVVAMMQSLCLRDYGETTLDGFGLTIMDEAHHVPAKTYMTVTKKIKSEYVLALTATPDRKDGLQYLLHYGFGDVSHVDPGEALEKVTVHSVTYSRGEQRIRTRGRDKIVDVPSMITDLAKDDKRTLFIAQQMKPLYSEGRCIIVLSDRILLLDKLCEFAQKLGVLPEDIAYFVGSRTTEADRERAKTRRVILATYHEAREGLDIQRLDTAIFATPIGDARQAVGRIQRGGADKMPAVLIDVVDPYSCFRGMAAKRGRWYSSVGFDVVS